MNNRPSRVPSPSEQTAYAEPQHEEAIYAEVDRPNLPAHTEAARIETARTVSERVEALEPDLPATGPGSVIAAIAAVMAEIKPVEKLGWNDFQKYAHVRMQDLSRELTPLMGKHGIVVFQTEEGRELFDGGGAVAVRYRFTVVHKSGEIWPQRPLQTGVSSCRNTKGTFDDKALNKCHTAARKYFLLSLFQIASEDEEDSDRGPQGVGEQRPRPRRQVPSPSGKLPPHLLPVIDKEAPVAWATRFKTFVEKADSEAEINRWYEVNAIVFAKLKTADPQVYNDAIDFMDACSAKLAKPAEKKSDPISTGKSTEDFPGDKPLWAKDSVWLKELSDAFARCEDTFDLSEEQRSIMLPAKDSVSEAAWAKAMDLVRKHLERVQVGG